MIASRARALGQPAADRRGGATTGPTGDKDKSSNNRREEGTPGRGRGGEVDGAACVWTGDGLALTSRQKFEATHANCTH